MNGYITNTAKTATIVLAVVLGTCAMAGDRDEEIKAIRAKQAKKVDEIVKAGEWTGRCMSVEDGDVIMLADADNVLVNVRLYGIDAPERKQDFGVAARNHMRGIVNGKEIKVDVCGKDKKDLIVGHLRLRNVIIARLVVDGVDVGEKMVRDGMAWVNVKEIKNKDERDALMALQDKAKEGKLGLWSREDAVAPWEFRKMKDDAPMKKRKPINR